MDNESVQFETQRMRRLVSTNHTVLTPTGDFIEVPVEGEYNEIFK